MSTTVVSVVVVHFVQSIIDKRKKNCDFELVSTTSNPTDILFTYTKSESKDPIQISMIFCRIPFHCITKHSVKWNWPINNQPRTVSAFKYSGRDVIDLKMRWSVRLQCLMMYEVWHSTSMLFLYTAECFRFVFAGWNQ